MTDNTGLNLGAYQGVTLQGAKPQKGLQQGIILPQQDPDSFVRADMPSSVQDTGEAKKRGFSLWKASKNFISGVVSPITTLIQHPLMAGGVILGGLAVAALVPEAMVLLVVAGGAYSMFQVGKGIYNAATKLNNGDGAGAEHAFEEIGAGTAGVALTAMGIRGTAAIAAESKATALALNEGKSLLQATEAGMSAAAETKNMTFMAAVKENLSLLSSAQGRTALFNAFKPSAVSRNFKASVARVKGSIESFKQWHNLKNMSNEQIAQLAQKQFDITCKELGIPENLRPKLRIPKEGEVSNLLGGGYSAQKHEIFINPKYIRSGQMKINDMIPHELRHAKEALLRSQLSESEVLAACNEEILNGIRNGEPFEIVSQGGFFGPSTMKPPKFPPAMRQDVAEVMGEVLKDSAENYVRLANRSSSIELNPAGKQALQEINAKLNGLIDKYPEFAQQFAGGRAEALAQMTEYTQAQSFRSMAVSQASKISSYTDEGRQALKALASQNLSVAEKEAAIASVKGYLSTVEGNVKLQGGGFFGLPGVNGDNLMAYTFSKEEILARTTSAQQRLGTINESLQGLDPTKASDMFKVRQLITQRSALEAELEVNRLGSTLMDLKAKLTATPENAELLSEYQTVLGQIRNLGHQTEMQTLAPELFHSKSGFTKQILKLKSPDVTAPMRYNPALLPRVPGEPVSESGSD